MAKDKEQKVDKGGKIRVIVFELEGSNETLQESLRTVASALEKTTVITRILPATKEVGKMPNRPELSYEPEIDEDLESDSDENIIEVEHKQSKPATKRKPIKLPEIIDIDFTSGDISFSDFVAQKDPSSDVDKYLVIMYWLQHNRSLTEINNAYAFTFYRLMKWKILTDTGQPFRNAKFQQYVRSGSDSGFYLLTSVGINQVDSMGSN